MSVKVSVCIVTYNHERFIAQAVESALMQDTDFDYEIVIGEDCSTDGTRAILLELRDRHPDKIRLFLREENMGASRNFNDVFYSCRGEYVALLDGDDYWTCRHKLKKQVDLLEKYPECVLCGHKVYQAVDGRPFDPNSAVAPTDQEEFRGIEELLRRNNIASCSVMVRNGLLKTFPPWYCQSPLGDWPFLVLHAQYGRAGFVNEVLGVHRQHAGGVWTGMPTVDVLLTEIKTAERLDRHFDGKYTAILNSYVSDRFADLARHYTRNGDMRLGWTYLWRCVRRKPLRSDRHLLPVVQACRLLFPEGSLAGRGLRSIKQVLMLVVANGSRCAAHSAVHEKRRA